MEMRMKKNPFSYFSLFYIAFLGTGGLLAVAIFLLQQIGIPPERCVGDWPRMYEYLCEQGMVEWRQGRLLGYLVVFRGGLALCLAWAAGRCRGPGIRSASKLLLGIIEGCGVVRWFITAGGKGILLHILIQFPHMIAYIPMGAALLNRRFRRGALLWGIGVLTECYVNSFLLQLFFTHLKR